MEERESGQVGLWRRRQSAWSSRQGDHFRSSITHTTTCAKADSVGSTKRAPSELLHDYECTYEFDYEFTYEFVYEFDYEFVYEFVYEYIYEFVYEFDYEFVYEIVYAYTYEFVYEYICEFVYEFVYECRRIISGAKTNQDRSISSCVALGICTKGLFNHCMFNPCAIYGTSTIGLLLLEKSYRKCWGLC